MMVPTKSGKVVHIVPLSTCLSTLVGIIEVISGKFIWSRVLDKQTDHVSRNVPLISYSQNLSTYSLV